MTPLELVTARLQAKGCEKGSGQDWQCPAHDDEKASLGVKSSLDGKVLLNCQAGCKTEKVVEQLGLKMVDLFPASAPTVEYNYVDEEGRFLFQVVRNPGGKTFCRRGKDGTINLNGSYEPIGEWVNDAKGTRRVLFRLPQVIAAVKRGETIYVAEGEKDATNLVTLAGVEATCNPFGAGKWRDEYSEVLRGANVVVVADRDDAGYAHARAVVKSLQGIAASVRVVQPAIDKDKADASDHLEAGLGVEDFIPLEDDQEPPEDDQDELDDLEDFLDSDEPEYDWIVRDLIERFDRVIFTGDEGAGKSVLRRQIATCVAAGTHPFTGEPIEPAKVVEFDFENSRKQMRRKYRPLKELAGSKLKRGMLFPISKPEGIDLRDDDDKTWFEFKLKKGLNDKRTPGIPIGLVLAGPIYKMSDGDPDREKDMKPVTKFLDAMRVKYGCALVLEAHTGHEARTTKGGSGPRPRRPVGWSGWKRWPEFGMYIANGKPVYHWRGQRDEREWPAVLEWSNDDSWPWRQKETDNLTLRISFELLRRGHIPSIRELAESLGIDKNKIVRHKAKYSQQWKEWEREYGGQDDDQDER